MDNEKEIIDLRRRLHTLAERSGEEHRTAETVGAFLRKARPDRLDEGVGGTGIIAGWKGEEPGPVVMIRCELDALPIPEENTFSHRSASPDISHKCGHDGHMAIVCGVARELQQHPPTAGEVHLLFQPAEETGEGAEKMLGSPEMGNISPDYIFALHNLPGYRTGDIICRSGTFAAASSGFIASFTGATSHAAEPERGNSPAPAMAQLIQSLASLPQYQVPIGRPVKVTVIHARLGERAFGTTPGSAEVLATVRAWDDDLLETVLERAAVMSRGIAEIWGLKAETQQTEKFPATRNHDGAVRIIAESAAENGYRHIVREEPFSWSEDFGHFTDRYPGAIFGLGSGIGHPPLHAADYDFPDEILVPGIRMFLSILNQAGVIRK